MSEEQDLDAELARLFADERLTLTARPDAAERVLAGVRRRRQHAGAATAVAGVLLTGGLLAGSVSGLPGSADRADRGAGPPVPTGRGVPASWSVPPSTPASITPLPSASARPAPPAPSAPDSAPASQQHRDVPLVPTGVGPGDGERPRLRDGLAPAVLGPDGVTGPAGTLSLGMPKQDALDSGLLRPDAVRTGPGCAAYVMRDYAGPPDSMVTVSVTDGGVVSFSGVSATNYDGISTGAGTDEVLRRYPDATTDDTSITANVAERPGADYVFVVPSGTVEEIDLTLDGNPGC